MDFLGAEPFLLEMVGEKAAFEADDAADSPFGVGDVADETALESTDCVEFLLERADQVEKLLWILVRQDSVTGEQSVLGGVLAGTGLAFRGPVLRFAFLRFAFFCRRVAMGLSSLFIVENDEWILGDWRGWLGL